LEIEGRLVFPLGEHPAYIFKNELARVETKGDWNEFPRTCICSLGAKKT
jgi:hypothetical protein